MSKNNGTNYRRRRIVYPIRSSSWPNGNSRFDWALLQLLHARHRTDATTNIENPSARNDALSQSNRTTSATNPTARCSSIFESSNPFLPEIGPEEPLTTDSYGATGQQQHRPSSLTSSSQRSLWLADLLQEAIDLSSTIGFSDDVLGSDDDDNDDDDSGISDTHEHHGSS